VPPACRRTPARSTALPEPGEPRVGEVVVTGGTGFVGSSLIPELLDAGHPVTLLVRSPSALPPELRGDERLRFVLGDAADPEALRRAFRGAQCVLHLATCVGADPDRADEAMAHAARGVAEACRDEKVARLVFVSSTAALYLGGDQALRGDCGPDPLPAQRPVYARGKILAERALAEFARESGANEPEIVVLRPAIVVGKGGVPQHTGVGLWPSDTHCVGWGSGTTPLPFVLVGDCAQAIRAAVDAPGIGGRAFNLAGDVRWTAERYVDAMRKATGRSFRFHPQPLWWFFTVETAKYLLKRAVRRSAVFTSWRDFKSRAFLAPLDCSDAKQALGWKPVADPAVFEERAIRVHVPVTGSQSGSGSGSSNASGR
jgi:nucleoside-diphosphate-sugar epimerase